MLVPNTQKLRHEPAHYSNYQAARHWLEPYCFSREPQKARPHPKEQLCKSHRDKATCDSEYRVNSQFSWMNQLILRHLKQRIIS